MKKLLVSIILITIGSSIFAQNDNESDNQISTDRFFININEGITIKSSNDKITTTSIDEGYFWFDNFAFTTTFGIENDSWNRSWYSEKTTTVTTGFGFRSYIIDKMYLGIMLVSKKPKGYDEESNLHFQLGYSGFITKNIALEPTVTYIRGIGSSDLEILYVKVGVGFFF